MLVAASAACACAARRRAPAPRGANPQWLLGLCRQANHHLRRARTGGRDPVLGLSVLRAAQPSKPAKAGGGGAQRRHSPRVVTRGGEAVPRRPEASERGQSEGGYATAPKATYDRNRDRGRDRTEGSRAHPSLHPGELPTTLTPTAPPHPGEHRLTIAERVTSSSFPGDARVEGRDRQALRFEIATARRTQLRTAL